MWVRHAGSGRALFERAVAVVVKQEIGAIRGDVEIRVAIVVVVRDADAEGPASLAEAGLRRAVAEDAADVLVERDHRIAAVFIVLEGGSVGDKHVHVSVVVVVEECGAVAIGFDDVVVRPSPLTFMRVRPALGATSLKPGKSSKGGLRQHHDRDKRHEQARPILKSEIRNFKLD